MKIPFIKMHGCGNDYVYVDCFKTEIKDPESLAVSIADRHKGVGGDGLVLICPSSVANAKMRMFNLDGSEGKMCGNAIRCVAKYLSDSGYVSANELTVETLSGIKTLVLKKQNGLVESVTVNMGKASVEPKSLPINALTPYIDKKYSVGGSDYDITCVSMGNPHCVTVVSEPDDIDIQKIGPLFERDGLFPERVNTEFIKVTAKNRIKMRVWERGSGETLACGTGACAAAFACVLNGLCERNADITVDLLGGKLYISVKDDDTVFMTGEAKKVFDGEYYYED